MLKVITSGRGSHRKIGRLAGILVCTLLVATGCKTSDDAVSAAAQMSLTAKCLSDYYNALDIILAETDRVYTVNEALFSKPYTEENRQLLKSNEAELAKRAQLAEDFSTLADSFATLTGSEAAEEASESANKLATEVESFASLKVSSAEQSVLKVALQLLVKAIQEHKEREAAKAIDSFAKGLSDLFVKEEPVWISINEVYVQVASNLAGDLVDGNHTDNSALLKAALDPFALKPTVPSAELNTKLAPLAHQQIDRRKAGLLALFTHVTDAMAMSLQEMSKRVHLVAEDKPLSFKTAPLTLATVQQWVAQVGSL
jgi:hypothetical protein